MKIGTPVSFVRRNGEEALGRVSGELWNAGKGDWIPVNTSDDKKKPVITQCRPSMLTVRKRKS